jgi:hypothetical protein
MGPSLLIASCLILAVSTARWPTSSSGGTAGDRDLEAEIEYAINVASRVLSHLVSHRQSMFPHKQEPWFVPKWARTCRNDANAF